jgi:hypothetical protein
VHRGPDRTPGEEFQKTSRRIHSKEIPRCLTCRKRKTRCAGERPICSTCTKNGHNCLGYTEIVEKRKDTKDDRGGVTDHSNDAEDDYLDEEDEDERRHWKAAKQQAGNRFSQVGNESPPGHDSTSSVTPVVPGRPRTASNEWDRDQQQPRHKPLQNNQRRQLPYPRTVSFSEDTRGANNRSPTHHHGAGESNKVPYFRYFGPTAIVPGYKQMVVNISVRDRRRSRGGSFSSTSPQGISEHRNMFADNLHSEPVFEGMEDLPVYDPNDSAPVHQLIIKLIRTFFLHLGCNYPFLREQPFMRMLKEKRVEPILVDAMCALAARFFEHSIFSNGPDGRIPRSEYGHAFAQRARAATVDTFPCPSVGAVQACLLMAYEGFGANQDSALWMYLGLAIRMAVDLGLQKNVGVQWQGEKDPWYTRTWSRKSSDGTTTESKQGNDDDETLGLEEQHEVEQERIDTFWAVFMLDRVISSGTGRTVTFRDDDFELALPEPAADPVSGWPAPFPTFIQIIHLYGRASDVLNNIRDAKDLTQEKLAKLSQIENDLTKLYQKQDQRLHFNACNFQEYVKTGQGTTFILLHFWFHALIIILHQPTLLAPFGSLNRSSRLLGSRELSMSSAKTIADILAFAELIDPKSFIGNPFTSQPMYIAACAFLMDSVANASEPASRDVTPPPPEVKAEPMRTPGHRPGAGADSKSSSKHSLLAAAANQNYQRCYKSLQQLNTYWGGVKYILTALDQKSKGIWDCETYTFEEYESTKGPRRGSLSRFPRFENPASPNVPPIAWSLTGTTNSPNSSLTLLYQNNAAAVPMPPGMGAAAGASVSQQPAPAPVSAPTPPGNMIYDPIRQSLPEAGPAMFPPAYPVPTTSALRGSPKGTRTQRLSMGSGVANTAAKGKSLLNYETLPPDDMDPPTPGNEDKLQMLNMQSQVAQSAPPASYTPSSHHSSTYEPSIMHGASPSSTLTDSAPTQHPQAQHSHNGGGIYPPDFAQSGLAGGSYAYVGPGPITDVITFDSQDVDINAINALGLSNDMMPTWLEYLPGDVLGTLFDAGMNGGNHQGGHMG